MLRFGSKFHKKKNNYFAKHKNILVGSIFGRIQSFLGHPDPDPKKWTGSATLLFTVQNVRRQRSVKCLWLNVTNIDLNVANIYLIG